MPGHPQEIVSQLLQFVARNAGLVLLLGMISRLPPFRHLFYRQLEETKTQVWFTSYWSIAGLLATKISFGSAYVPFLAGRYGGAPAGLSVGLVSGAFLLLSGGSLPSGILHVVAGGLGGLLQSRLTTGKSSPTWVAFAAGFLSVLALDLPDRIGTWVPMEVMRAGPQGVLALAYLTTLFGLADLLFIRLMEFLMSEGERYHAQASVRLLELADKAGSTLATGLTDKAAADLAIKLRQELDLGAVCIGKDGRLLAFDGECAHLALGSAQLPTSGDHKETFSACPQGCPYNLMEAVPIGTDGAWIAMLGTAKKTLNPGLKKNLEALGAVLTGMMARTRHLEQKAELEETRHRFLQAQIRPHFLFNSLNTIASIAKDEETQQMVLHLAGFLRESFRRDKSMVSLERELEVVDCYLAIEMKRFGDRLTVKLDLADPLPNCELPSFSLQPLVENAVHHGIGAKAEGGEVRISAREVDSQVEISVEDDGPGIPESALSKLNAGSTSSANIGMANVKQRLETHFGQDSKFAVQGSRVSFRVPLRSDP